MGRRSPWLCRVILTRISPIPNEVSTMEKTISIRQITLIGLIETFIGTAIHEQFHWLTLTYLLGGEGYIQGNYTYNISDTPLSTIERMLFGLSGGYLTSVIYLIRLAFEEDPDDQVTMVLMWATHLIYGIIEGFMIAGKLPYRLELAMIFATTVALMIVLSYLKEYTPKVVIFKKINTFLNR